MAINAWLMMLVASLIWIVRRHHVSALAARAAAPVGAVMTVITNLLFIPVANNPGDMLLLEAFGGGFTWGSALVRF